MQLPAIHIAQAMGIQLFIADGNADAPGAGSSSGFYHIDLKDLPGLTAAAADIRDRGGLDGVLTVGTDFSASVAWVAQAHNLPGISYEAALNASRKDRMRKVLREHQIPCPGFVSLTPGAEDLRYPEKPAEVLLEKISREGLEYPLVVKPGDNMGARGVRKISGPRELGPAAAEALRYSPGLTLVLEEEIRGVEYSLDSLISDDTAMPMGIARRSIDYPPYYIERGHDFPSGLSEESAHEMFDTLFRAAAALGISRGAAKGDVFMTERGPVIGEVAARLSGGYMSGWTYPLHSGVHPAVGAVLIALGENPGKYEEYFTPQSRIGVSERGMVSIPGTLKDVIFDRRIIPAGAAPGSREEAGEFHFITVRSGDELRFPRNNVEKCGNIICREEQGSGGATSAQRAEAGVAAYLFRLAPVKPSRLQHILGSDFPPAYPRLMSLFLKDYAALSLDSDRLISEDSYRKVDEFTIPQAYLEYGEQDWNYRSLSQSLRDTRRIHQDFSWAAGGSAGDNPEMLFCLLRAGYQGLCYYLEAENSQNHHNSTDISRDEAIRNIIQEYSALSGE
ncbi:ATP-grasp domain-containing protein [Salinispira pacifica]|uniref:ATP-grasp domain-containing protein n=1 Tax=Salinispira pacifica TaxID=1307761 RepID=V5WI95_9SPIO|nr:ATP-grasp domain-containing protein [Salinispira pacifica]AHC15284.1 hypothetical protein L21SP2_1911 [Salinispira pacifica]